MPGYFAALDHYDLGCSPKSPAQAFPSRKLGPWCSHGLLRTGLLIQPAAIGRRASTHGERSWPHKLGDGEAPGYFAWESERSQVRVLSSAKLRMWRSW